MSRASVSAWWKAQDLLARRPHGSRELTNKLKLRDYPAAEIDSAIERLFSAGLLNDEAFARSLANELFFRRGYGYYAVIMRLRQKGLTAELCERVTNQFFAELDEGELLAVVLRVITRRKAHEKDRNKLFTWLKKRGFRSHEISCALQAWFNENGSN